MHNRGSEFVITILIIESKLVTCGDAFYVADQGKRYWYAFINADRGDNLTFNKEYFK